MMWIIGAMNWHMGRLRQGQNWSNDGSEGACQPHIDDHATENDDEANNNTIRDGGSTVLQTADTVDSVDTVDTVDTVNMAYTAQWSRCQLGCSCSQNFPCKLGSCYMSILSEIRV